MEQKKVWHSVPLLKLPLLILLVFLQINEVYIYTYVCEYINIWLIKIYKIVHVNLSSQHVLELCGWFFHFLTVFFVEKSLCCSVVWLSSMFPLQPLLLCEEQSAGSTQASESLTASLLTISSGIDFRVWGEIEVKNPVIPCGYSVDPALFITKATISWVNTVPPDMFLGLLSCYSGRGIFSPVSTTLWSKVFWSLVQSAEISECGYQHLEDHLHQYWTTNTAFDCSIMLK